MDSKAVFQEIQPLCVNVCKNLDLKSVKELDKYLTTLLNKEEELIDENVSVLNDLKEYISLPLVLVLKKQNSSQRKHSVLEVVLKCLGKVLSHSFTVEWIFYQDVFILLFLCITSPENPQIVDTASEECQIEALKNIIVLTKLLSENQMLQLCSEVFRPQLGHAVYICLKIAETEKNKELVLTSFDVLLQLGSKSSFFIDPILQNTLSATWASFLPGIALSTTRIATRKVIQNHKITVAAIECWEYFVCLVMRDKYLKTCYEDFGKSDTYILLEKKLNIRDLTNKKDEHHSQDAQTDRNMDNSSRKLKNIKIDREWVKSTSDRLLLLIKSISSLVCDSHWNVRKSLCDLCHSVLTNCICSLQCCVVECLEMLITLKNDPAIDVCNAAGKVLKDLKSSLYPLNDAELNELLQERLFTICTKLPNIIKTQDDRKILVSIKQLLGFLEFLEKRLDEFIQLPSHLQRLSHSLSLLFTYDYSDNNILEEQMHTEDSLEIQSVGRYLCNSFKYFHSDGVFLSAVDCCTLIGLYGDTTVVVDHCVDLITESSLRRNETLLLLSLILKGSTRSVTTHLSHSEKEVIVSSILDMIKNLKILETQFSIQSSNSENSFSAAIVPMSKSGTSLSVEDSKKSVILVSNTLELIGVCAMFLQKDFETYLSQILCQILEKAGESNLLISLSARICLGNIANSCGYESISSLVQNSVHLFWFDLSQKLKRLPDYPSSPQVLRAILKNHQNKDMTFIEDLVEDILESLDSFYHQSLLPLLTVLLSYVETFASMYNKGEVSKGALPGNINSQSLSLITHMVELDKKHNAIIKEMQGDENEDITSNEFKAESEFKSYFEEKSKEENVEETNFTQEETKDVPKNIHLINQILNRCSYLLFVKDRKCQLTIFEIIKYSFVVIKDYENQMLPCCHKIWKPLLLRFKGGDYVVVLKCLEIVMIIVKASKDFLKQRFISELYPFLSFFLESNSSESLLKTEQSGYYTSPLFKVQREILKYFPDIIERVNLTYLYAEDLMRVILLYLDIRQPSELVRLAFETMKALSSLFPDVVWLALSLARDPFKLTAPDSSLDDIFINGKKVCNLYPEINLLLEELNTSYKPS